MCKTHIVFYRYYGNIIFNLDEERWRYKANDLDKCASAYKCRPAEVLNGCPNCKLSDALEATFLTRMMLENKITTAKENASQVKLPLGELGVGEFCARFEAE